MIPLPTGHGENVNQSTNKPSIVIVVGPTCSGKTELAVRLAERFNGEIINADSMQVYRGMEIGTAKPSPDQRRRVPHHLVDIVEPDADFSASDFREEAARAIRDIRDRGRKPFIVGGTGLYIKALLQGLVDSPSGAQGPRRGTPGDGSHHREVLPFLSGSPWSIPRRLPGFIRTTR